MQLDLFGKKEKLAEQLLGTEHSRHYRLPNFDYQDIKVTQQYIDTLPDIQNNPSAISIPIQYAGIDNFRLPIKYAVRCEPLSLKKEDVRTDGKYPYIPLETSITGFVSLEAHNRGINMSRVIRTFYEYLDKEFAIGLVEHVLNSYKEKLGSYDAKIYMKFSYPMVQNSLRSGLWGYQYYDVVFEVDLDREDNLRKYMELDFVYSSACPCSFELSQHALKYRNQSAIAHSQRSVARLRLELRKDSPQLWIEDVVDLCRDTLQTEVQAMVKREDEQAFAEKNGSYPKFVEDAVRQLHKALDKDSRIRDFRIIASHQESLHPFNAASIIVKGIKNGMTADVSREVFPTLIHTHR